MQSYESHLNGDLNWALLEGSMHFEGNSAVHRTLRRLASRLDALFSEYGGVDYAIAGGMALFFHGYCRFTETIEILVTSAGLQQIHDSLDGLGYVRPFEKSKNLRDAETGVEIDFLVTGQYPGYGKPCPIAFPNPALVSDIVEGIHVVDLPRLIESKIASGRASHRSGDWNDVQRLIQALKLQRNFINQLDPSVHDIFLMKWEDAQQALKEEE